LILTLATRGLLLAGLVPFLRDALQVYPAGRPAYCQAPATQGLRRRASVPFGSYGWTCSTSTFQSPLERLADHDGNHLSLMFPFDVVEIATAPK
jgi:hypothetical protein